MLHWIGKFPSNMSAPKNPHLFYPSFTCVPLSGPRIYWRVAIWPVTWNKLHVPALHEPASQCRRLESAIPSWWIHPSSQLSCSIDTHAVLVKYNMFSHHCWYDNTENTQYISRSLFSLLLLMGGPTIAVYPLRGNHQCVWFVWNVWAWSIWIYRLCREGRRKTVEVCVEPTFQNGGQNKRSSDMHRKMLSYYSKPKYGSYCMDPRGSLPLCKNDIESVEKHYVCKNPYCNRKYSTEHGNASTGTFAVWADNRFLAYDSPTYYCKWGSPNAHITRGSFLRNWNVCVTL